MLSRKVFKNFNAMVILVLFKRVFSQTLFNFFAPSFDALHEKGCILFTHFDLCVLGVRLTVIKEVRNYEKLYSSKTLLKMAGGKMHSSHTPSGFTPDSGHCYQLKKKTFFLQSSWR